MSILVTGGTGFIGSHQAVSLIEAGIEPVLVDDSSNSHSGLVLDRIAQLTGVRPVFAKLDVRDTEQLSNVMSDHEVGSIIHFAGRKHVAESIDDPTGYARVNIDGLASVVEAADASGVHKLIFSSSGSVYGNATVPPINEAAPHEPTNPYSATKSFGEALLRSVCASDDRWSVVVLRYFNPAGAHPTGLLGEDPTGPSWNLLPSVIAAAVGESESVKITGDDFPTADGSGVRDYVHVLDVAEAHLRSLALLDEGTGFEAINIGRGVGVSVKELIEHVGKVAGVNIPVVVQPRRRGDASALFTDPTLARERLGLSSYRSIGDICIDALNFRRLNPGGYRAI